MISRIKRLKKILQEYPRSESAHRTAFLMADVDPNRILKDVKSKHIYHMEFCGQSDTYICSTFIKEFNCPIRFTPAHQDGFYKELVFRSKYSLAAAILLGEVKLEELAPNFNDYWKTL